MKFPALKGKKIVFSLMRYFAHILILFFLYSMAIRGQAVCHEYSLVKNFSIPVQDNSGTAYKHAWAGGLNSCQFSATDMNSDGIRDLFVFDRLRNKKLTFINNGTPDAIDYVYSPEYESKFPAIHDWAMLIDYNCDGKEDIFTYSIGGIAVYKNVSDSTGLKFELVTPLIYSLQSGGNYVNLYVTPVDYPAISDIDNDGDLDILTFFGLGSYVEYHKNMSVEKYGNCDSLDFVLTERCWGKFKESESSNHLTLDITCPWKGDDNNQPENEPKHTGSTLLATDLDGDNDKDLILGDVDYPNLVKLTNGGTPDSAYMTSMDTTFPSNTLPVHIFSFLQPYYIDVDNDGLNDMIVSPFDPNMLISEDAENTWLYKNTGTNSAPVFNFQVNDFLQGDMVDLGTGAYPVFYDYNKDGLTDLFISNYGYWDTSYYDFGILKSFYISQLALFENTGTQDNPEFKLTNRDFFNLSTLNLKAIYPTFGDIDGDGDDDMILGESSGKIHLFENTAGAGNPINLALSQMNYKGIDAGDFSTPQLIDIDRDSLTDLVIGNKKGRLSFYKNTGTANDAAFTLITDSLGGVYVADTNTSWYGYSVPYFFEDTLGKYKLFVGSESGYIFYYKDIDEGLAVNKFTLAEPQLDYIYEGARTGVAVKDINNDGFVDMIVGNYSGGIGFFKGDTSLKYNQIAEKNNKVANNIRIFPNPANNMISVCLVNYPEDKKSDIVIRIISVLGKEVYSKKYNDIDKIDIKLDDIKAGIYVLEVLCCSGSPAYSERKKIIIRH